MPYSHITTEERDFLQSAFALSIDKSIIARILGKHISTVYREVTRNTSTGYYIATEAHKWASNRRLKTKPQPKLGNAELMVGRYSCGVFPTTRFRPCSFAS